MEKSKRGRPSKLTPELTQQIADLLQAGNFVETVVDHVGISKETFYNWMRRGERGWQADIDGGHVAFSDAIKKAMTVVEMNTVQEVREGVFNWQSRAWWLERRYPDRWGNRQKHEHTGKNGGAIIVNWGDGAEDSN